MRKLNIGGLIPKLPIIQGGMGICVSLSGIASAVANEGGIGVISAVGIGMLEPNYRRKYRQSNKIALTKEIRKAREKSDGIIGVNIMMAITDFDDMLQIALEENVDVVFIGAGLFLKKPKIPEGCNTKFIPKVSSARAARLIFNYWAEKYNRVPDGVVVEGPKCGGHVGFKKDELLKEQKPLSVLIKETVAALKPFEERFNIEIPVIAAGGIYTGTDMYEIMEAGASAVKMGTRFVTTHECDVSDAFKQTYLRATPNDITLIDSPVGLPGRVISNPFVKRIQAGETMPVNCAWKCLKTCDYKTAPFCIASALFNAAQGNLEEGFSFAGSKAYLAEKLMSVKDTINEIMQEYSEAKLIALQKLKPVRV